MIKLFFYYLKNNKFNLLNYSFIILKNGSGRKILLLCLYMYKDWFNKNIQCKRY